MIEVLDTTDVDIWKGEIVG